MHICIPRKPVDGGYRDIAHIRVHTHTHTQVISSALDFLEHVLRPRTRYTVAMVSCENNNNNYNNNYNNNCEHSPLICTGYNEHCLYSRYFGVRCADTARLATLYQCPVLLVPPALAVFRPGLCCSFSFSCHVYHRWKVYLSSFLRGYSSTSARLEPAL